MNIKYRWQLVTALNQNIHFWMTQLEKKIPVITSNFSKIFLVILSAKSLVQPTTS